MDRIKCSACKRQKFVSDFLKNGKTLKTCIACRVPKKVPDVPVMVPVAPVISPVIVPVAPVISPVMVPDVPVIAPVMVPRWRHLSGKWIKHGDEHQLHQKLTKKMIREFKERSAFAVHKYLTMWLMVDIRDV